MPELVCAACEDVITDDEGRVVISDGPGTLTLHVDCAEADDA